MLASGAGAAATIRAGATMTYPPSFGSDSTSGESLSESSKPVLSAGPSSGGRRKPGTARDDPFASDQRRLGRSELPCCRGFREAGAFVERILDRIHQSLERLFPSVGGEFGGDFPARLGKRFAAFALDPVDLHDVPAVRRLDRPDEPAGGGRECGVGNLRRSHTSELRLGLRPNRDILRREAGGCRGCGKRLPAPDPIGDRIGGCLVWRDRLA